MRSEFVRRVVMEFLESRRLMSAAPTITSFEGTNHPHVNETITLRATAADSDGTVSSVKFYREDNQTGGLQVGGDTLVGTGTFTNGQWSISLNAGPGSGMQDFYAVATDSSGDSSVPAETTVEVEDIIFGINGFTITPSPTTVGSTVTLAADAYIEPGVQPFVSSVKFYRETNGSSGLQTGQDTLVGSGTKDSDGLWKLNVSTAGLSAGTQRFYAMMTISSGESSPGRPGEVVLTTANGSPVIENFNTPAAAISAGAGFHLDAKVVATQTGTTIASVTFYLDSDGTAGLNAATDTLLGPGTLSTQSVYYLNTENSPVAPGNYTVYVLANASNGKTVQKSGSITIAGALLNWELSGQTNSGTEGLKGTSTTPAITNSLGLTRGSGVAHSGGASKAWGGTNWGYGYYDAVDANKFITFGVTVNSGYTASFTSIDFRYRRSDGGPDDVTLEYQLNNGDWNYLGSTGSILTSTAPTGATATLEFGNFTAMQNVKAGTTVNFRLTPSGATAKSGTFYFYNQTGADLSITGAVTKVAVPPPVTGSLLGWEVSGQSGSGTEGLTATSTTPATTSIGLTRGSGVAHSGGASKAWGGTNWAATSALGISGSKFVTFGLKVNSGYSGSLSSIDFHYRRSTDGPTSALFQYQLNNGAWVTIADVTNLFPDTSATGGNATLNLSGVSALQNLSGGTQVNFRITPYGANTKTATWYIYNQTGTDLSIKGSYVAAASVTAAASQSTFSTVAIRNVEEDLIESK